MFRNLCGEESLKNVIFTTTGWGLTSEAEQLEKASEKEGQLCVDGLFCEPMIRRGAQTVLLQIQHELVDDNKNLVDTKVGNTVNEEVKRLEAKYRAEIESIKAEMERALEERDMGLQEALNEHRQKLENLRDETHRAQDLLQYQRRQADRQYDSEMQGLRMVLEEQKLSVREETKKAKAEAAAQRYEDELQFEGIVERIQENFDRVRKEEHKAMEAKIQEMENEWRRDKVKTKADKKKGRGKKLLLAILLLVGNIALSAVGFALGIGPLHGIS